MFTIMFSVGILSFSFNRRHLLSSLISLEYMVLVVFLTISLANCEGGGDGLSLAFLTISVCGGALGLSVLVSFARLSGGESLEILAVAPW